jgi:hypothetical protein
MIYFAESIIASEKSVHCEAAVEGNVLKMSAKSI